MKNINLSFFCLFLFFSSLIYSQERAEVQEVNASIDGEEGNALRVLIYRTDEKTISKAWKSKLKDYDAKVKTPSNKIIATKVIIPSIQEEPIRVNAKIEEIDDKTKELLIHFIVNGQIISSSSHISAFTAAKIICSEFAFEQSKISTKNYLEKNEDMLDELKDEISDLKKTIEKAKDDIKDAEKTISDNQKVIKESHLSLDELSKKLKEQEKALKMAQDEAQQFN